MDDGVSGNGQAAGLPPRGTGRRRSLIFLAVLLVGLPLAFFLQRATDTGWRPVATVEALEQRDVVYVEAAGVFVVAGSPPVALSDDSPHVENDPVAFCPSSETFQEIHGGLFDRRGYYLDGPPPRGLDRVAARVGNGVVEINLSMVTEGAPRGAGPPAPPAGPFCFFDDPSAPSEGFLPPPELPS